MIIIEPRVKQLLIDDALDTFPDECCGFLFGREERDGTRVVIDILVVDNSKPGDKTRRFEISTSDYMAAEQHATDHDWTILGIYHSHPKHPAIPSEQDRVAAQPYFSYLIISLPDVSDRGAIYFRSWLLNDDLQFEEEKIADFQVIS
jgi:proteasome lid subunit RPN8/RPN11